MKKLLALALLVAFPLAAQAESREDLGLRAKEKTVAAPTTVGGDAKALLAPAGSDCTLTETAQINVSFNSIEKDAAVAGELMDGKIKEVDALAKELKLEKFDVQSMNYSLYPYNSGTAGLAPQWQISGNLAFNVTPATKGKDMLALLVKKGLQPSLSINAYKSGNCQ